MTNSPEVAFGMALVALAGVLFTAFISVWNARKRGELDFRLLEIKSNLDKLNALELAKIQAEHSAKLKELDQVRSEQIALSERRRNADSATLIKVLEVLDPNRVIAFLRNHDFAGTYDREEVEPLLRFRELAERPDSEFLDPKLEQMRIMLVRLSARLAKALAMKTHPRQGTLSSVLPEHLINDIRPKWVDDNAVELNDCATEFVEAFENLVREARKAHIA